MNCVYLNKIFNCTFAIFVFCMTGYIETVKIYNFINDEIPFFLTSDVCSSEICKKDAERILSSLNTSVNPCEDFYEFACGGWLAKNKRPNSEPVWGQWEPIIKKVEKNIEDILVDDIKSDFVPINTAREIYKACMNYAETEKENQFILNKLLNNFGGWPIIEKLWSPNEFWPFQVAKINSYLNVHPFFNFHVSIDLYDTTKHALYLDHPSFFFPKSILSNPTKYEKHLKAYELYIINCAFELSNNDTNISMKGIKRDAFDIVKLETKLVNLMTWNENINNLTHVYKRITIDHLQFLTNLIPLREDKYHVQWIDVIKTLFKNTNVTITSKNYIIVKDLSYILKLIHLLQRIPPRIIENYIGWNIVKHFAKDGTRNLQKISFTMEKILHGVSDNIPRKQYCISIVNNHIGLAVAYEYVQKHFDMKIKNEVYNMIKNIKSVLLLKLKSLKWMDEETKVNAIDKAKEIAILVGYPDWLKNSSYLENFFSSLDKTKYHILNMISCHEFKKGKEISKLNQPVINERWSGMPTDVNAYYNVLQNVIIFPTGILQYPFFTSKRIEALNYGSIGTIIGHELSHAFDNTGRQADKHGNLIQWWTKDSLDKYRQNIKCFHDHYEKYTIEMLKKTNKDEISINVQRTQDENIADVIGIELAFTAYKNTNKLQYDEQKLPGLENYTSDQYFFLNYANQWCEASSDEQLSSDIMEGDHTPSKIRVLGTLSNSAIFNKAFDCPTNSAMNPSNKCVIW